MQNFRNRQEIEEFFKKKWNLKTPTQFELNNWKCKFKLSISPSFLIGKKIKNIISDKNGVVKKINWDYRGIIITDENNINYRLKKTIITMFNPITNMIEEVKLLPGAGCNNIWSDGFFANQKIFKSYYYKTEEYKNKTKKTSLKKYGVEHPMKNNLVKQSVSKSIKEKYGVDWFLNRGEHYDKIDEIMMETYGHKVPIQNCIIKEKIHATIKEKYGVDWFLNRGEHYDKIDEIMMEKYGVKNILQKESFKKYFKTSKVEKKFIEELLNLKILESPKHILSDNGQLGIKIEKKIFYVDIFDEKTNLVIEFYGDYWHCNPLKYSENYYHKIKKKTASKIWEFDMERKTKIISKLNCNFFEVWEHDWIKNKKKVTSDLIEFIKSLKHNPLL